MLLMDSNIDCSNTRSLKMTSGTTRLKTYLCLHMRAGHL
jgi:hypothetical protein